jgi:hypothetical protein
MKSTAIYLAVLRTKEGERDALINSGAACIEAMVPLFEVGRAKKKRVDEHLKACVALIQDAWRGNGEFLIDISDIPSETRSEDGMHPITKLDRLLETNQLLPTFCFSLDRGDPDYRQAVFDAIRRQEPRRGAIRLQRHDLLLWDETLAQLNHYFSELRVDEGESTVIVDLRHIGPSASNELELLVQRLQHLRSMTHGRLVLLASSMLESARIPTNNETNIPRHEVSLWEAVTARVPGVIFGDYGVINPSYTEPAEGEVLIPAPKARYPRPNGWVVIKGHRPIKGERNQYRGIATQILASKWFRWDDTGWGAENIRRVASPRSRPGSNANWIGYCTQLHLDLTTRQTRVAIAKARSSLPDEPRIPF